MPTGQLANEQEAQTKIPQRRAGTSLGFLDLLQERTRRIRAELDAISRRLREEERREETGEGDPAAPGSRRKLDLWRVGELVAVLRQAEEILSRYARGRNEHFVAGEEEILGTVRPTISPQGIQAHPRFRAGVRVSVKSGAGPAWRGRTLNLSNSGVALTLSGRIIPGTAVNVTLHLRETDVHLPGMVIWSDEAPLAGIFGHRHGIKFRREQPGTFALDIFTAEHPRAGR